MMRSTPSWLKLYCFKTVSSAASVCLGLDMGSCFAGSTTTSITATPAKSTPEAVNRFGLELLVPFLGEDQKQSLFVSPLSVTSALAMVLHGARGETEQGMLTALGATNMGSADFVKETRSVTACLHSRDQQVTFLLANSVWSTTLLPEYIASLKILFNVEAQAVAPQKAPINEWCKKATEGLITEVLKDEPDPTGAVLTNALYFKGSWKNKFDAARTKAAPFNMLLGGTKECQMMEAEPTVGTNKFLYGETDMYQAAALPYGEGNGYSAMLLLPRIGGSPTLEMTGGFGPAGAAPGAASKLRAATVQEVLREVASGAAMSFPELTPTKGSLFFPRFKIEFGTDLKDVLIHRGMSVAFGPTADFSGMSSGLALSQVIHKTVVEVNEEGTTAAAVTAAVMPRSLPPPEPTFEMRCDRPFIFLVRHDATKLLLFAGVIGDV